MSRTDSPGFGDVRALLQRAPSAATWEALIALLEAMPHGVDDDTAHYVRAHLIAWPSSIKRAPMAWLDAHVAPHSPSPRLLASCTALRLGEAAVAPGVLEALVKQHDVFTALRVLEAPYYWKSCSEVITFLRAPWCASLEKLDITGNPLGGEGLSRLTDLASHLTELRWLGLRRTALRERSRLDPMALLRFLQSSLVQQLTHLDLSCNEFGWGFGETLTMGLMPCERLEALRVSQCDFIGKDIPHLARLMQEAPCLAHLDVTHNHLDDELFERLFKRAQGTSLERLELHGNAASMHTMNTLARCIDVKHLTIGDEGSAHEEDEDEVMHMPYEGLEHLSLHGPVHELWRGLFTESDALPDLHTLELMQAPSELRVLDEVLEFIEYSDVRHLSIHALEASEEMCRALAQVAPGALDSIELPELYGPERWRAELLGIDWVAETLMT